MSQHHHHGAPDPLGIEALARFDADLDDDAESERRRKRIVYLRQAWQGGETYRAVLRGFSGLGVAMSLVMGLVVGGVVAVPLFGLGLASGASAILWAAPVAFLCGLIGLPLLVTRLRRRVLDGIANVQRRRLDDALAYWRLDRGAVLSGEGLCRDG